MLRCRRSVRGSSRWVSCGPGSCGACRWVPWRLRRGVPWCVRMGRFPWGVLARRAVGVLVGAALPGAVGVVEVCLHAGRGGHACMRGGFGSPVPCRAVARQCGRWPRLAGDGVLRVFGVVPRRAGAGGSWTGWRVPRGCRSRCGCRHRRPGRLPGGRGRPVGGLGRPVAGHDHGLAEPGASGLAVAAVPAGGAPPSHGGALVHAQASGVDPPGLVHAATAPVRERPPVAGRWSVSCRCTRPSRCV